MRTTSLLDREQVLDPGEDWGAPTYGSTTETRTAGRQALRVLVADDNRDTVDSLSMLLTIWGHKAIEAYGGADALDLAIAYRPDVLLLDVAMPGMSGCEVVRRARQERCLAEALMIAITGLTRKAHRLLAEEAGFDRYLVKPACPLYVEGLLRREQARLAGQAAVPGLEARPQPRTARLPSRLIPGAGVISYREVVMS
jgi:CheY-like chemotaxis protein